MRVIGGMGGRILLAMSSPNTAAMEFVNCSPVSNRILSTDALSSGSANSLILSSHATSNKAALNKNSEKRKLDSNLMNHITYVACP